MIEENKIYYAKEKRNCNSIKKIVICEDVTDLEYTFILEGINHNYVIDVDFSNNFKIYHIPPEFFYEFHLLKKIELPENIKKIYFNAFYRCSNLETIILHGVEEIESNAFDYCHSIKTIILSKNIKKIKEDAFLGLKYDDIEITCPLQFETYFRNKFPNANFTFCDENNYILK